MHIAIVGTGVVGACTAGWLQRDGHTITFVDPREAGEACSFGNAGSLSPSACLPVGMPGMWRNIPKWLLDPEGPLVIRAHYLPRILPWLLQFMQASTEKEVVRIATAVRNLLRPVFEAYEPLAQRAGASSLIRRNGCLYVYSSRESARRWKWGMDLRRNLGVEMREVDSDELAELEPALKGTFRFGQFASDNGSTPDPSALVKAIYGQAIKDGATHVRSSVTGFELTGGVVDRLVLDDGERLEVDGVVLAAGAWSARLSRQLGARIPLESQRGYHVTVADPNVILERNVMAVEHNIMVNPMHSGLRLAGTVEFAGLNAPPRYERAESLLRKGNDLFPGLHGSRESYWMGHRPCLPDSLPVIGLAPKADNAFLGFGHGHVGMCGGATTGREIANLVSGRDPEVDLSPFSPTRFR
ncbi:NAD(P)/FAD-dependent oxidoreductase [Amorphus sp. 3PC139-8]|uniref:NAD(P)/FAD-dependent oxidoreductase n=1 Tax=Amorphus sp. 3PC139-8 TaxID=2735676 RepID=UPI00345CFC14